MSAGLLTQLRSYYSQIDEMQETIRPDEVAELLDKVRELPPSPVAPPSPRRGLLALAVAAAVVLLLVGGVAWLSRLGADEVVDPTVTTVTTTSTTIPVPVVPPAATGVLGPGSWSVAATLVGPAASDEVLSSIADEVRTWPGVLEVAVVDGEEQWLALTGLEASCGAVDTVPPCAPGIVALVVSSSMQQVALRLESDHGMNAITPLDAAGAFWDGYVATVSDKTVPLALGFDPALYGTEMPLATSGEMSVEVEVDGFTVRAEVIGNAPEELVLGVGNGGTGFGFSALLIDRTGHGGAFPTLDAFTDLNAPIGPRRLYAVAGLPIEAELVTFELADGTRVWQRPLVGMALFVDEVGSMPDRFVDYYDQDGIDPDELEELGPAKPMIVLDVQGTPIMRIEDTEDETRVIDLRLDLARLDATSPVLETPDGAADLQVTDVIAVGGNPYGDPFGVEMIGAGDAVWAARIVGEDESRLVRIEPATRDVTDEIAIAGWVVHLVSSPNALWAMDSTATVSRIDLASRQITDTYQIPAEEDSVPRSGLLVADGGVWVSHTSGFDRIDLDTLEVERFDFSDAGRRDGDQRWLGESGGALWLLGDRAGDGAGRTGVTRVDPATGRAEHYSIGFDPDPEAYPVLANDAIWMVDCCDGEVARFDLDTATLEHEFNLGRGLGLGVYHDDAVWVPNRGTGTIARIDTTTREVTDVIAVDPRFGTVVIAEDGSLWGLRHDDGAVWRIDTATRQLSDVIDVGRYVSQLLAYDGAIWAAAETSIVRIATAP